MSRLDDLRLEAKWRKYSKDAATFIESCVYIEHPRGRRLLVLRDAQRETLGKMLTNDRVIILKARQIGFTTLMAAYVLWLCLFQPDQSVILLSRTERDARDFQKKIKYAWDGLPDWVVQRAPNLETDTLQSMGWSNGSQVESLPSKENPARGRTVTLVIVDEWAFLENPEEAWASIQPITDIGGKFVGLSTANGWGNFFHTMYVAARNGNNGFCSVFYPWWAVPERDQAWYEQQKLLFPLEWQIHQEYPADDDEAFIKSGRTVFDVGLLQELEAQAAEHPPPRVGNLHRAV